MNKVPMHTNVQSRHEWVQYILHGNERKCRNIFRLSPHVFGKLCNALYNQYGYEVAKEFTLKGLCNYIGGTWT